MLQLMQSSEAGIRSQITFEVVGFLQRNDIPRISSIRKGDVEIVKDVVEEIIGDEQSPRVRLNLKAICEEASLVVVCERELPTKTAVGLCVGRTVRYDNVALHHVVVGVQLDTESRIGHNKGLLIVSYEKHSRLLTTFSDVVKDKTS